MTISKTKALQLVSEKIEQFEKILKEATYENRYKGDYERVYDGTETLIKELFSKEEAMEFRRNETSMVVSGEGVPPFIVLEHYTDHINSCISQLKVYGERISNFWRMIILGAGSGIRTLIYQ